MDVFLRKHSPNLDIQLRQETLYFIHDKKSNNI